MDIHAAVAGFFATIQRLFTRDPQLIKATSLDDLIRKRFGANLTDKQVRNVFAQAEWHLVHMRSDARNKKLEPNFYIADALRCADFKPILNEAEYDKHRAMHDRVFMQVAMGR